jgi:hypothetical protein
MPLREKSMTVYVLSIDNKYGYEVELYDTREKALAGAFDLISDTMKDVSPDGVEMLHVAIRQRDMEAAFTLYQEACNEFGADSFPGCMWLWLTQQEVH